MAQNAGRKEARCRLAETAQGLPYQFGRPHGPGERPAQLQVLGEDARPAVEEHEVDVLLGGLDERVSESRIAQDAVEILGDQIAAQIELAAAYAGHDRGRAHVRTKLDRIEQGDRACPIVVEGC